MCCLLALPKKYLGPPITDNIKEISFAITQTRPCNILQFFTAVKTIIFG